MKGDDNMSAEAQLPALPCKAPILTDAHNKRVCGSLRSPKPTSWASHTRQP